MCYQRFSGANLLINSKAIDTTFFNKFIEALFINHCDVIHSIFISVRGKIVSCHHKTEKNFHFIRK